MQQPYRHSPDNISYSTLMNFIKCGHFYKLTVIDNLGKFDNTLDTIFGTLMHRFVTSILTGTITEIAQKTFSRTWLKLGGIYDKYINHERYNIQRLNLAGLNILKTVKESFEKNLPGYSIISIEESIEKRLRVKIGDKHRQFFKGFIDIVLKLDDGNYVIIDLKTCSSLFYFKKNLNKYKEMQLVLYKHFYAKLFDIDPDKINTYFTTLEKNPKVKEPVQFIAITTGKKKISNHLKILDNSLSAINREFFMKNRSSCIDDFGTCIFYKTEYCS